MKKDTNIISSWLPKHVVLQNKQLRYYNQTEAEVKEKSDNKVRGFMPSLTDKDPNGILNFDILKCTIEMKGPCEFRILVEGAKR
jgi:hypothetical protein